MALRNAKPMRFVAAGLSDTLDGTDVFPGACSSLQNLVKDAGSEGVWVPRPAATSKTTFTGFTSPGVVACMTVIGSRVYGLIASSRTPGYDEPFCYDIPSNTFITISGVTAANVPGTQASSGAWTPPTMALMGTKLLVTHPGFSTIAGNYFGWFELSNPAAPVWNAGNTTVNLLPARPTAVAQYGQRAFFLVNPTSGQPAAYMTDVLLLSITNSAQVLTFDDNLPLTAAVGLPLDNQLGGIIQSLIIFKGATNMVQITGDYALGTLSKNTMNVATGTNAPWSIAVTSKGVMFMAPDGIRLIDFGARVSDPIGINGAGVNKPFVNALYPSRVAAAANVNTYRITVQDGSAPGTPTQEYWFDVSKGIWSGPHTSTARCVAPYAGSFIVAPLAAAATLWESDSINTSLSTFTENGSQLQCRMTTALLPDTQDMAENCIIETAIELTLPVAPYSMTFTPLDESGSSIIAPVVLTASGSSSFWGSAVWGASLWLGAAVSLVSTVIPWTDAIVFKRLKLDIQSPATANMRIGAISARYQQLGYIQQ